MTSSSYESNQWSSYCGQYTNYQIKGLTYRSKEVQEQFALKSSGTKVLLMREPNNPHDINAIAIYAALTLPGKTGWEWTKIGYVDRYMADREFSSLLPNVILEGEKYSKTTFALTGKTRQYV